MISAQPSLNTPTVYLIDQDEAYVQVIRNLIEGWGMQTRWFTSGEEFLAQTAEFRPGCLVIEHSLPGIDGLALQKLLAERGNTLPLIVLSGSASVPLTVEYLKSGASTLLEKPSDASTLRRAVDAAIAADEAQVEIDRRYKELLRLNQALTDRERLVLDGIVSGRLNKIMAKQLEVSTRTVETIRASVFEKFHVATAPELAAKATELRLLSSLVYRQTERQPTEQTPAPPPQRERKRLKPWSAHMFLMA